MHHKSTPELPSAPQQAAVAQADEASLAPPADSGPSPGASPGPPEPARPHSSSQAAAATPTPSGQRRRTRQQAKQQAEQADAAPIPPGNDPDPALPPDPLPTPASRKLFGQQTQQAEQAEADPILPMPEPAPTLDQLPTPASRRVTRQQAMQQPPAPAQEPVIESLAMTSPRVSTENVPRRLTRQQLKLMPELGGAESTPGGVVQSGSVKRPSRQRGKQQSAHADAADDQAPDGVSKADSEAVTPAAGADPNRRLTRQQQKQLASGVNLSDEGACKTPQTLANPAAVSLPLPQTQTGLQPASPHHDIVAAAGELAAAVQQVQVAQDS